MKLKLNDPYQIRKSLQKIGEETAEGNIDIQTSKTLAYLCQVALQSISVEEQQKDRIQTRALAEKWEI